MLGIEDVNKKLFTITGMTNFLVKMEESMIV